MFLQYKGRHLNMQMDEWRCRDLKKNKFEENVFLLLTARLEWQFISTATSLSLIPNRSGLTLLFLQVAIEIMIEGLHKIRNIGLHLHYKCATLIVRYSYIY